MSQAVRQALDNGQATSKDEPTPHGHVGAAILIRVQPARSRTLHEVPKLPCLDSDSKTPTGRSRRTCRRTKTRSPEQNMPPLRDVRNADRRSSRTRRASWSPPAFPPRPRRRATSCSVQFNRRTWRRGLRGDVALPDIRAHMADFKEYVNVDVVPAHWERPSRTAG